jgi:uncharacterized protein (TIGR02001 family)
MKIARMKMKMKMVTMMTLILAVAGCQFANAKEVSVSGNVELLSGYVYKGATWNDGFVLQPSVTIENWLPISVSFWGNMDIEDFGGTLDKGEFSEVDLSLGYDTSFKGVNVAISYNEFWYPNIEEETEREAVVKLSKKIGSITPYIAPSYMLEGSSRETVYIESGLSTTTPFCDLKGAVGYYDRPDAPNGFSHYQIGVTKEFNDFYVGVDYIGQIDDEVLLDANGAGTHEVEWLFKLGYNF